MAAKGRLSKAEAAAKAAQNNQYLQRLVEDEKLRANLISAYGAARGERSASAAFLSSCCSLWSSSSARCGGVPLLMRP